MKKILITGGNGFVGMNIINELISKTNCEIVCLINKNSDRIPNNIEKVFDINNVYDIDMIIHCGGNPSSKSCIQNPSSAFYDNIEFTFKILEYARNNTVKKIIFFSSGEVYGCATDVSKEDDLLKSYNMYGASKVACEHMCSAYCASYDMSITCIRLINTYGDYCQEERFPSIIKKKFENEIKPHFILSGNSKKRWLDIKKMAEQTLFIINNFPNGFEVFNFVGEDNIDLVEFITKISNSTCFTYEYNKEEIYGYRHECNADGSKFLEFCENKKSKNVLQINV